VDDSLINPQLEKGTRISVSLSGTISEETNFEHETFEGERSQTTKKTADIAVSHSDHHYTEAACSESENSEKMRRESD